MPGVKLCFGLFVFFILFFYFFYIYFLNFISKAQKLYFWNRLNESFSGNVGIFSIFFYFLRKIAKRDKFFKVSSDRKSTRLNSSHVRISYAVFCLKKKKANHDCQRHCDTELYYAAD